MLAGLTLFALFVVLLLVGGDGFGGGDMKLGGLMGLLAGWFSWQAVLFSVLIGLIVAGVGGLVLVLVGRLHRKSYIPLGPWLILGTLLAVAVSP